MKKLIILLISLFFAFEIYSQKIDYYEDGRMGLDNLKVIDSKSGFLHSFGTTYQGIKGSPNMFNSFVSSYVLVEGQEKYINFDSDINLLRNSVIFMDPSLGIMQEISSDHIKELIYKKYDKEFIFRTTKGLNFDKRIKDNKFYQLVQEKPYRLIMITFKTFSKADSEPVFNSGRHFDEFKSERKFYLEDAKGIFHHIILNKLDYNYILHPSLLDKKEMAKLFPEEKDVIYKEFEYKPDSISIERIYSILNKF